jgi:L-cysteine S-thiosulfotransferase
MRRRSEHVNVERVDRSIAASRAIRSAVAIGLGAAVAAGCTGIQPGYGEAASAPAGQEVPLDTEGAASTNHWQRYANWRQTDWSEFNTMRNQGASPAVGQVIAISGEISGDPAKGKELAFDRGRGGSCLACHTMPGGSLPGNVGPDLSTVGLWGRSDEWLYNYVYDARVFNPNTVMPPWGAHKVYTDEEIRHIVAFLKTLDKPIVFEDPAREDPNQRALPQNDVDNLDPVENPAMMVVDDGEALFNRSGSNGQSCASCHASPAEEFKTWAAQMPRWEPRLDKVMSSSEFVTRHARATTGDEFPMQTNQNLALTMYLTHLANGQPYMVDVESPGAKEAAERGKMMMETYKVGQLNFACMDCHGEAAGKGGNKWIRGQFLTPHQTQLGNHPYYRTSNSQIWDLRKRMQWCGVAVRANDLEPEAPEYGDIELYLTHLVSQSGKKLNVPGLGH